MTTAPTASQLEQLADMRAECAVFRKRIDALIRKVRKTYNNGAPLAEVEQLHALVNDCEDSYIVLVNNTNAFARSINA
jgi:hypothetical protein